MPTGGRFLWANVLRWLERHVFLHDDKWLSEFRIALWRQVESEVRENRNQTRLGVWKSWWDRIFGGQGFDLNVDGGGQTKPTALS
jgi:hypothetical protein